MDKASATKTVNSDTIPGRVKPKTLKIGICGFPCLKKKDSVQPPPCVVDR